MNKGLTEEEKADIAAAIDSEGFDYYFNSYGPDKKLFELIGPEISAYQKATQDLEEALRKQGIELE